MTASSYFSPRFSMVRVVWEGSTLAWMVFTGMPSALDGCTLGALVGALAHEVEGPLSPLGCVDSIARACSFSIVVTATF